MLRTEHKDKWIVGADKAGRDPVIRHARLRTLLPQVRAISQMNTPPL